MMKTMNAEDWSEYWADGSITTFKNLFHNNYDGEIMAFWSEQFSKLESDASIVDLACGNGALARMAEHVAEQKNYLFNICAVDFAQIHPDIPYKNQSDIRFYSHCPIEKMPFDDATFDMAVSQYGFEYADLRRACAEVSRVLKPKASFSFIAHSVDSALIADARQTLRAIKTCLNSSLLKCARVLLEEKANTFDLPNVGEKNKNAILKPYRDELNREIAELVSYAKKLSAQHIQYFVKRVANVFGGTNQRVSQQLFNQLDDIEQEYSKAKNRMEDMIVSAFDEPRLAILQESLTSLGFYKRLHQPIFYQGKKFGIQMEFFRDSGH